MKNVSLPKDNKDSIPEPTKGLEGIVAADTTLSSVNGEKGVLRYCGYNIDDLALNTTFEEIICLLYDIELPNERTFLKFFHLIYCLDLLAAV